MTRAIQTVFLIFVAGVSCFSRPAIRYTSFKTASLTALNVAEFKAPVFDEVCDVTGITLKRFVSEVVMMNPELGELATLFGAIETACKAISNLVKRSQLPSSETLGYQGEVNVQGEDQKKLDVITNDILKRALRFTGRLGVLASEQEDVPVPVRLMSRIYMSFIFVCIESMHANLKANPYSLN
jgi:hypothetical protein